MLVLNHGDVIRALSMRDCIAAVRDVLARHARGDFVQFERFQLRADGAPALMGLMPVVERGDPGAWALKDVMVAPGNRARGLDSHQGAVLLHDGATGELTAIVDATAITALRTAAASAVATEALMRAGSKTAAIVGSGRQARAHIDALRLILPDASVMLWARSLAQAEALAAETGAVACAEIADAVRDADVICTTTASKTPILRHEWLKPGCHINAVGASSPTAREIGDDIVAISEFYVDSRAQAATECGEYLIPRASGAIAEDHIRGELGEVLIGRRPGRSSDAAITVFKSLGVAVEDLAAATCAVRNASALGVGQKVAW